MAKGTWLSKYYCPKCRKSFFIPDTQREKRPLCPYCGNFESTYCSSDGWITAQISVDSEENQITIQYDLAS